MIHVFNGCKTICSLPGQACTAMGQCCANIKCPSCPDVDCSRCQKCCEGAGKAFTQFMDKPLSSFVVIAGGISLMELWYSADAYSQPTLSGCELGGTGKSIGVSMWLMAQMGFAVINIIFAPWFQNQVWKQILERVRADPSSIDSGKKVSKNIVQAAFKSVFLEDLGVLFYFFTLIASFVWGYEGTTWIKDGTAACQEGDNLGWAAYLGLCVFWVAFLYSSVWYCCACCASSVQLSEPITAYEVVP